MRRVERLLAVILVVFAGAAMASERVPLPHPRPPENLVTAVPAPRPSTLRIGLVDGVLPQAPTIPTDCQLRLAKIAQFQVLPMVDGPGECGAWDFVKLEAVLLPDKERVTVNPPAKLNCRMAESVARFARDAVAPAVASVGVLRGIVNYDSYSCRGRNRVKGAKISEHGKGNALDIRAFKLDNGKQISPTDVNVDKKLRDALKAASCARFKTVLGPGSDGYHEEHIHLDLAVRRGGYRLCRWIVREPVAEIAVAPDNVPLPRPRPVVLRP